MVTKDVDVAFLTTLPPHCVTNLGNKMRCTVESHIVTPLRINKLDVYLPELCASITK